MQPRKGNSSLQIPITFDNRGGGRASVAGRPLWVFLVLLFWLFTSTVALIVSTGFWKFGYPLLSFFLLSYVVRFLIIRENYFRTKRQELIENEYMFPHNVFWNIYEISNKYPYIVQFANGLKGVFIALDKDVIVGKDEDYDYHHHEAIADAYQQMEKRGLECMHIDFMDTVGKDSRLEALFNQAERIANEDLRRIILRKYDHIESTMNRSYASYDVYCFYSVARSEIFWDELQIVLGYFRQANYIRARALNRDAISALTESILNLENFSVNEACDNLFKELNKVEYLRPIWVEKDGTKTILNTTLEESDEIKRVAQAEKQLKKKRSKSLFSRKKPEEDIDLFD
jgi:hypothetical protein